jgi:hypothetical protein
MMRLKNFEPKKYVYSSLYFSPAIKKKERRRKEGRKEGEREGGRKGELALEQNIRDL